MAEEEPEKSPLLQGSTACEPASAITSGFLH